MLCFWALAITISIYSELKGLRFRIASLGSRLQIGCLGFGVEGPFTVSFYFKLEGAGCRIES